MLRGGAPANELDVTNVIVSCWKEFEISIPCNNPRCCDILAWGEERATFSVSWYHSGPIYWIFVYGNMSWHWLIPLCCTILSRKEYDVFTLKKEWMRFPTILHVKVVLSGARFMWTCVLICRISSLTSSLQGRRDGILWESSGIG